MSVSHLFCSESRLDQGFFELIHFVDKQMGGPFFLWFYALFSGLVFPGQAVKGPIVLQALKILLSKGFIEDNCH